jgi:DNA-binding NarL/FixJ family response regulator
VKPKVLLISWNEGYATQQAARYECEGWDVMLESEDGGRAYKLAAENKPDVVVIYMAYRAKHGIETARAIHARKSTSDIPVVFVYQ